MTLFSLALLISLALYVAAAIPGSRVTELPARIGFLVTAVVWVLGR